LKTLVGIDFSLNSPAFCILRENEFTWGSLTRSDRTEESLKKNTKKPYHILSESGADHYVLMFMGKDKMPEEYSERERIKIDYFQQLVDEFWGEIESICAGDDIIVAMEGLSFASNGNALIDISMATALLRKKIVDHTGSENFYVYSPTSVKKFAYKGNAKKHELYNSLIEREFPETNLGSFTSILDENKGEWITGSGNVNKPLDDIIDATWICLFLYDSISKKD
jgi:hypothetical protein